MRACLAGVTNLEPGSVAYYQYLSENRLGGVASKCTNDYAAEHGVYWAPPSAGGSGGQ